MNSHHDWFTADRQLTSIQVFVLSCGVVESFSSESFQEKIKIRFSHHKDFETLPGSCLFMMALETCNASVFHVVEGAKKKLEALDLNSHPGENVTNLAGKAQRLLKIMAGTNAVPVNTGLTLLIKLTHTSSETFNRKVFVLLDDVMTLESEYELTDPCLFAKDVNYKKCGPLALIATIWASHGMLLSQQHWLASAASLPQSNNSSVPTSGSSGAGTAPLNGRKFYAVKVITSCATVLFLHQQMEQTLQLADALHQRTHRYVARTHYIPGPVNAMADDASCLWHLTDTDLLTHFDSHYPQLTSWTLRTLTPTMASALTGAIFKKRRVPESLSSAVSPPIPLSASGRPLYRARHRTLLIRLSRGPHPCFAALCPPISHRRSVPQPSPRAISHCGRRLMKGGAGVCRVGGPGPLSKPVWRP